MDPHQANFQPHLLLFNSRLRFNLTLTFLAIIFDRILSFSKHVSSLKAKFFPCLKALCCIFVSLLGFSKKFLFLLQYKAFLRPLLTYALPGWFPFLRVTNITKLVPLHQAASYAISYCLSFSPIPLVLSEASLFLLRITLTHFALSSYKRALRFPISFSISGLDRLGVKSRLCISSWRAFASTHSLMLPSTSSREILFTGFPHLLGTCLPSLLSPPLPLPAPALILLFLVKMQLSLTLTLSHLTIW